MKCPICKKMHKNEQHPHYRLVADLSDDGFPIDSSDYMKAHLKANKAEKEMFPKGYHAMKKIDSKLPKHELTGKNTKTGKIEVSSKVPKKLREEVAYHEEVESKQLRKKK